MAGSDAIREHMEVIGADGGHIGTVDKVEAGRIKLTRSDRGAAGSHHYLPVGMVDGVEGERVRMSFESGLVTQFWEGGGEPG